MEYTEANLDKIGRRIRQVILTEARTGDAIRRARTALLEEIGRRNAVLTHRRRQRSRGGPWGARWLPLLFAAAIGAGAAGLSWWTKPGSFQVGEGRPGQLRDKIESLEDHSTQLRFSEGSTVMLHEGGRMRVLDLDRMTAQVLLEDGVIDVSIARHKIGKTDWTFEAGPYHVLATGTKFQMAFQASDQSIRLAAQEGQVLVSGGCEEAPRTVSPGERLELCCLRRQEPEHRR